MKKDFFLGKYGDADDITLILHSGKYTDSGLSLVMNNPHFGKRHLATVFEKVVPLMNQHMAYHPTLVNLANHPDAHVSQLEKLVKPHRGYPFTGTIPHRWPEHAKIAKKRIDASYEDDE